jgi:CAAX protease family protein
VGGNRLVGAATDETRPGPLVGALVLLAVTNLLGNLVAPGLYLLWTCLAVVGLLFLARVDGLHPEQWGLGPVHRRAALAALAFACLTAAVMLVGTRLPGVSSAFVDQRVSGMGGGRVAFFALVRAPLGTAVFEEVAFRGILLAMFARRLVTAWAVVGSSVAFGVWHILPAVGVAAGNAAVVSTFGGDPLLAALAGIVAAGLAGAFLCLLRIRYDHLIVPVAVHATATSLGYLLAWLMMGS